MDLFGIVVVIEPGNPLNTPTLALKLISTLTHDLQLEQDMYCIGLHYNICM